MRLSATGLSRRFGSVRALDGVSFSAGPGEIVGIIGPNGAGKSTLLACIGGLAAPDEGTVHIDDAPTTAVMRRRALFYLPDQIVPWSEQRVSWALDFAAQLYGAKEDWRTAICEGLTLTPFVSQRVRELSKGQRKRMLLAIALLVPRPVVLVDEPFDGLDPRQARAFGLLARERAEQGRTFVLSVHAMGDATRTCDRHLLLHEGHVIADGTLEVLRARASLPSSAGLEEVFLALT